MIYTFVFISGRMVRNENVSSNSQFHHLPSDMSWGFDSASESHFERIPQSPRLGLDGEQKSSTGVLTSYPTADSSNLPGYKEFSHPVKGNWKLYYFHILRKRNGFWNLCN